MRTAGDWRVVPHRAIDKRIEIQANGVPIAWVDNDDTDDGPDNAKLMALAPRLLAMLQEVDELGLGHVMPNWRTRLEALLAEVK